MIARYADLGVFSILSVGILTVFYSGLLDLAKVFLDPLDNEDFRDGCVYMDLAVLVRESNAASYRWMNAGASAAAAAATAATATTHGRAKRK